MKNFLDVKDLGFQSLPWFVEEGACLYDELKNSYTEASDFKVPLQCHEMLETEVTAIRDQVANLLAAFDCAIWQKEFVLADVRQRLSI